MARTKWQRKRLEIPKGFTPAERKKIGEKAIEHIIERSKDGKKADNRSKFPGYTEAYEKKKGQKNVDLTLKDIMLKDMEVLSTRKTDSVVVGYKNNTKSNSKADGNIRGTYGKPTPDSKKARPFLDINKTQLKKIIKEVKKEREE